MWERRPMLGALIGLTLCVSIWRISTIQESQLITSADYSNVYIQNSVSPITTNNNNAGPAAANYTNVDRFVNKKNNSSNLLLSSSSSSSSSASSSLLSSVLYFESLSNNDFTTLIDLTDFKFLINQEKCNILPSTNKINGDKNNNNNNNNNNNVKQQPFTLILVHSAPENWNKRIVIRETWGHLDTRSRILFLLGAVNTTIMQHRLEQENQLFNDIIQGNFIDAYRNMTYKHVMALKWFIYYCSNANYLLKTDDDVFVNSINFYEFIDTTAERHNLLFCYRIINAPVKRSYRSKWRVSPREYSGRYYPPYCPGFSILYSSDIVHLLYKEAQRNPYFWIDDVHVTGTIAQKSNITITPLGDFYLNEKYVNSIIKGFRNASSILFLFTSPNLTEKQIRTLWKLIIQSDS